LEQIYDVLSIIHMPLDQPNNAFGYSRVLSSLYVLMARNRICCLLQNLASIVPGLEPAGVDLLSVRTSHTTFDTSNFYVFGWEPVGSIRALNLF
jgi:hypothetical protein